MRRPACRCCSPSCSASRSRSASASLWSSTSGSSTSSRSSPSACTAILLIAPVAVHRLLFREHRKDEVVDLTAKLAASGLALLALSILSAVLFVLDVVLNLAASIAVTAVLAGVLLVLWVLVPIHRRSADRR